MSYPTSVDNIPDLQDGVDYIEADDLNVIKDAAQNAQTLVGSTGAAQSHNTDIMTQLMELKPTIRLSYVDADTVQASAGICKPRKSDLSIRKLRKNTSTTDITAADLDSGVSFAADTEYYVHADGDAAATTVAFVVSTSASAPAGVTNVELIGGFSTDASANIIEDTVWSVAGARCIQVCRNQFQTVEALTISNQIPQDNSKPQNTEGHEITGLRTYFKATNLNNLIEVDVNLTIGCTSSQGRANILAMFKDSDADAIAVSHQQNSNQSYAVIGLHFKYLFTPADINKHLYKFHIGADGITSGKMDINGFNGAALYGDVGVSCVTFKEWEL